MADFHTSPQSWKILAAGRDRERTPLSDGYSFSATNHVEKMEERLQLIVVNEGMSHSSRSKSATRYFKMFRTLWLAGFLYRFSNQSHYGKR